jgi:hypothetical protein
VVKRCDPFPGSNVRYSINPNVIHTVSRWCITTLRSSKLAHTSSSEPSEAAQRPKSSLSANLVPRPFSSSHSPLSPPRDHGATI